MRKIAVLLLVSLAVLGLGNAAFGQEVAFATLSGFQQVPAIITAGNGTFVAEINADRTEIAYEMDVRGLRGSVLQAHIHLAQEGVNGNIMLFICTNLGNGPAGTPACVDEGNVEGTWDVDSVVLSGQGIQAGAPSALKRAVRALRNGVGYVNVHTSVYPPGEIRGQINDTSRPAIVDGGGDPVQ